jgi:hypothetical protein
MKPKTIQKNGGVSGSLYRFVCPECGLSRASSSAISIRQYARVHQAQTHPKVKP